MTSGRMGLGVALMAVMLGGCTYPVLDDPGYAPAAVGEFGQDASDYAWIDRADALWDAIGQAPPDFTLTGGDSDQQWAWVTADGYWVITEPVGPDGVRGYYFEPGAMLPFLVRDIDWSYGFSGDRVAVVYGRDGRLATAPLSTVQRADAIGLLRRGAALRADAEGQGRRDSVRPEIWAGSAPILWDSFATWDFGYAADPLWGRYRRSPGARADRDRWIVERERRRLRAEAFRDWRARNFVGTPPPGLDRPGRPRPGGRPNRPDRPGIAPPVLANPDPVRRPVRREDALRPDRMERAPRISPAQPVPQPQGVQMQRPDRQSRPDRRPPAVSAQPVRPERVAPAPGRAQPTRPLYTPDRAAGRPAPPVVARPAPVSAPPPRAATPPPPPPPRIMDRVEPTPQLSPE